MPPGRHKMIILDEADSMTSGAQQALRRIMELYSKTTRFALACNTSSKVIEPIQSRCAILRFSRLRDDEIVERLMDIQEAEGGIEINNEGYAALLFIADGDMRQAINALQATVTGFGPKVTAENIFKVSDQPHPEISKKIILDGCVQGDYETALSGLNHLWSMGYAAIDIILTLFRVTRGLDNKLLSEDLQIEFIRLIGFTHVRIVEGLSTKLQLAGLLSAMCRTSHELVNKKQ